jgi:mono/diheme cytochrome c family protein
MVMGAAAIASCATAASCSRTAPAAERVPVDAAALFGQACAKCHAAGGTGGLAAVANGPRPIDLTSAEWQQSRSDAEIVAAIRDGRGAMPPFADVLTADQVAALAAHVRSLSKP